jgi:hypothetical protein
LPFSDGNAIRARDAFRAKSFRKADEKDSMKEKIRYAVVGLGHIAQKALLPAFAHAENSELAAPFRQRRISRRARDQRHLPIGEDRTRGAHRTCSKKATA